MNVDFGLICLFALQVGLVAMVYHAWRGIKAEISALEVLRHDHAAIAARLDGLAEKMGQQAERITKVELAPKAARDRVEEVEALQAKTDRRIDSLDTKLVSLAGRVSAFARHRKSGKVEEEEETDPASKDEGEDLLVYPPGSQQEQTSNQVIPPGFGKSARRFG